MTDDRSTSTSSPARATAPSGPAATIIPSASSSVTMRLRLPADDPTAIGRVTTAVGDAGGIVVALDMVDPSSSTVTLDLTVNAGDGEHAARIEASVAAVDGVEVHKVSDRTFLLHLGGKLEVNPTVPLRTRDDLSMAYTPGVARVCMALAANPADARSLTIKGNTVAIVTDGTAVLGLGDIGPIAALPVMEGKAALFKHFAGVDGFPICLDTKDVDEIVRIVQAIAPVFGGINLEDISAPRCFEIEERLRDSLDIPVFHDDQHGTAIVVLAALRNALRVVGKELGDVTVAMIGTGAAGMACAKLLAAEGVGDIVAADRGGILSRSRKDLDPSRRWFVEHANRHDRTGGLLDVLDGADVFLGLSGPNLFAAEELRRMAEDPIVFTLANPVSEVDPAEARRYAAVVATGRSDYPNQINNVLAFPGVFRGAFDARARYITEAMKVAAARAIADTIPPEELRPDYIVPSVFNDRVAKDVAEAVRRAATA
jgi:malate dehydrogenase (oxaloacetate-decarboxylating)